MVDSTHFNSEQKAKLTQMINEGMQVMGEVEALNEGLRDTVKAVAEELDVKPNVLKRAIRVAFKSDFMRNRDDFDQMETILETVGKTL